MRQKVAFELVGTPNDWQPVLNEDRLNFAMQALRHIEKGEVKEAQSLILSNLELCNLVGRAGRRDIKVVLKYSELHLFSASTQYNTSRSLSSTGEKSTSFGYS